jgi:arginase
MRHNFLFLCQNQVMQKRKIALIINTSEITAGTRGASLGPGAIMTAARKKNSYFFGSYPIQHLENQNHAIDQPVDASFAKNIQAYSTVFNTVSTAVKQSIELGNFPLILAGDHGSAAGTIAGIKASNSDKRLGVVWIDAHGDLHSPYTTPSGNMHGMPLNLTLGDDNLACQRNQPDSTTIQLWNAMKSQGEPRLLPSDLVFVAVRDTEPEEDSLIATKNIVNHTVASVRKNGMAATIDSIFKQLDPCDIIYVSFDVDSMDPELTSYGTGTPVKDGLSPEEANQLLIALAQHKKTYCIEFVEVNPCLDNRINTMGETAFTLLENVANALNS